MTKCFQTDLKCNCSGQYIYRFQNCRLLRCMEEISEGLPGGGGGGPCSLVPYKNLLLFPCSSKINWGVPRNSLLLSSHVPRNYAPCSLDPPKYSSLFPTISLIFRFHFRLSERGYPATILRKYLTEVKFADENTALQHRNKSARKELLPFVTQYHPALPSLERILMGKWHLY